MIEIFLNETSYRDFSVVDDSVKKWIPLIVEYRLVFISFQYVMNVRSWLAVCWRKFFYLIFLFGFCLWFLQVNFAGCSAFAGWCYGSVAFSVWHFGSAFCVRIAYFHLPALPFVSAALQLRCCGSELVLQALFCKLPFALVCITHVAD